MGNVPGRATPRTNVAAPTERAAQMWRMRVEGHSNPAIAAQFEITPQRVGQILAKYSRDLIHPAVAEYREIWIERLDFMWERLKASGKLDKGDPAAIASGVRIAERYAKLVGLDAAIKIDAEVTPIDPREIELRGLIEAAHEAAEREIKAIRGEEYRNDQQDGGG